MTYFQLDWHVDQASWPEWGSTPRGPVLAYNMAHQGELMNSVIGPDVETGKPMVYHILRCELCILTHALPLPAPYALKQYYANQFYQQEKPDYVARYERDRTWWEKCVHEPILRQCGAIFQDKRRIVFFDIGAGPGISLDVAKRLGYVTFFLEPNSVLADRLRSRGHSGQTGTLETMLPQPAIVDILYLYEVLEHQPCPEDFLVRCLDMLVPGGVIVVVVPNDYNPLQLKACQRLGLPQYWLSVPQHLQFFTPKTLQLLLRRCGFDIRDARSTYALEEHLLAGENYVGHDDVGRKVHTTRMQAELQALTEGSWEEIQNFQREQLASRRGRELVYIAQKP